MNEPVLRIHFLVEDPAEGPIVSEPAGTPVLLNRGGRFRVACNREQGLDEWNRGTNCPWAVRCRACIATEDFQRLNQPRPGRTVPDRSEAADPNPPPKKPCNC